MSRLLDPITNLSNATKECTRVLKSISESANQLNDLSTSTLLGTAGGLAGLGLAYSLSLTLGISLGPIGIILTGLGITSGILACRGRRRMSIETRLEENKLAAEEIMRRIKALPKSTPGHVRAELWKTYQSLNSVNQIQHTVIEPQMRIPANTPELLPGPSKSKSKLIEHKKDHS